MYVVPTDVTLLRLTLVWAMGFHSNDDGTTDIDRWLKAAGPTAGGLVCYSLTDITVTPSEYHSVSNDHTISTVCFTPYPGSQKILLKNITQGISGLGGSSTGSNPSGVIYRLPWKHRIFLNDIHSSVQNEWWSTCTVSISNVNLNEYFNVPVFQIAVLISDS